MSLPRLRHFLPTLLIGWLALCVSPARAEQSIALKLIAGKIILSGQMRSPAGEVPCNLLLDLGTSSGLILHKNAIEMMGVQETKVLDLTLGDARFNQTTVVQREDMAELEEFTTKHAAELGEVPLVGIVGRGLFAEPAIQLDLPGKALHFGKLEEMAKSDLPGAFEVDVEATGRGLDFDATTADGVPVRVSFGTRQYESLAEFASFKSLKIGKPDAAAVKAGETKLLDYCAWRPSGLMGFSRPLPDLVLGNQFLSSFRVLIDTTSNRLRFEPIGTPPPHEAEQAYFVADRESDANAIETFLDANKSSWLFGEAAARLLDIRLKDAAASDASTNKALEYFATSLPDENRSALLLQIADTVLNSDDVRARSVLAKSLDLAAASASKDLNASAAHQINARKGLLAMREGDMKRARRFLLAAAFGMPGDSQINLWLGDFYRKSNQPARAWSRYVEAALVKENTPPQAFRALEDLMRDSAFRKTFPISEAELMLEGRVVSFSPPRARAAEETANVQLVEVFADGSQKSNSAGRLAFDGLREFYAGTPTVFLSYFADPALGTGLTGKRASMYGFMSIPAIVADGQTIDMSSGDETAAFKVYDACQKKLAGPPPANLPTLKGDAQIADGRLHLRATLHLEAPPADARELRLFAIVNERCVFAVTGAGTALHYAVARGTMSGADGLPVELKAGDQSWDVAIDLADLNRRRPTTSTTVPAGDGPPFMRPADPDPRELSVALFVQDTASFKVLRAILVQPSGGQP